MFVTSAGDSAKMNLLLPLQLFWLKIGRKILALTSLTKIADRAKRDYAYYSDHLEFEDKKILDVGCGDGTKTNYYAKYCSEIVGVDFRKQFRKKLDNVSFIQADASHLPFRNDAFDAVLSNDAFEHISRPNDCLGEIKRVARKSGMICINFGPLWRSPFGSHLDFKENFLMPYAHLLFSKSTINQTLWLFGKIKKTEYANLFGNLSKISISDFEKFIRQQKLKVVSLRLVSPFSQSYLLKTFLREYITTQVVTVLEK